jgi:flagellar hook-basal body complex protein FliE
MVENIHNDGAIGRSAPAGQTKPVANASAAAGGAAFQALLERLETQARELAAQSQTIESPEQLTGAVDRAHASLQDALSLGDRLLEAYRESLARASASPASAPASGVRS